MDLSTALLTRRSIRSYQDRKIEKDILIDVLKAAMHAPSAKNQQPWEFLVVDDPALLKEISEASPYTKMAKTAAAAVLVCGNMEFETAQGFWTQDCSAAMQNLLLAAHGKGLGAVWCGVYPEEDRMKNFSRLFSLPKNIVPFALCVLGYPLSSPGEASGRFKEERIHYNAF